VQDFSRGEMREIWITLRLVRVGGVAHLRQFRDADGRLQST
jgi:hypothetical protein